MRHHAHRTNTFTLLLAVVAAIVVVRGASAQERARDYIEPRISKTQFQHFLQDLGLQSDQKQIVNIAFADYEASLTDLAKRLDEEAIAAGRQAVDDSLSGKSRLPADDLRQLRGKTQRVYLQAGAEVDAALDALVWGVNALLTPDQEPKFEPALRALRREILLHPRSSAASHQEYAGDGLDVLQLVEEARAEGGELAGLQPDALSDVLSAYEIALDEVLTATASADRQGAIMRKIAGIEKDAETLKREEQAALARWQRLYDLNKRTVDQVAATAQARLGAPAAAKAFRERFERESFAWLYPRRKPDRQIEWIREQTLPPENLQEAETVYALYLKKRDGLSHSAIEMMLKARLEFQTFLHAMMDPASVDERLKGGLHSELLKNTGEQSHLESTAASQLEALLDDKMRHEMREALKRPDRSIRSQPPLR